MFFWWLTSERRRRHQALAQARAQLQESTEELLRTRAQLVLPMREIDRRNHYSDLIRDALRVGYGERGGEGHESTRS